MSAPNPSAPMTPGAAPGVGDPTMEDILASIRKILNEDETIPVVADTTPEPLVLTEDMLVATQADEPSPPAARPVVSVPAAFLDAEPAAPPPSAADLVAPAVAAAAAAAVGSLVRAVAAERNSVLHRGGPSIEDVVREELRPLLKAWLDTHLPVLVERLVRAEIERVVGRSLP